MLAMAQINFIKHLRDCEDQTISGIAKKLNIDWRTAKKYADQEDWNKKMERPKRRQPIMDPYVEIVDAWLLEDQTAPRKQRHTAKRIYDRLVEEHQFTGSERTVRYYVAKRKIELKLEKAETYTRLDHPGGEGQVDFGTVEAILDGKQQTLKQLTVSFPYSNAAFPCILPAENAECFLEGLKRIFEHIGGVPTKLWFDNLSAAVISVESGGKRKVTEAFERFCLHYRFEAVFCNPGKGNEKGHVENKVGYTRRNWCVPIPIHANLNELQLYLDKEADKDMDRPHHDKGTQIRQLWEEESVKLLKLPTIPFEAVRIEPVKVNSYGEVKLDDVLHFVPEVKPGQQVWLRVGWDKAEVLDHEYKKLTTIQRSYMHKSVPIDWKERLQPFRYKPRSLEYASICKPLPSAVKEWLFGADGSRKERLVWLLRMLETYPMEILNEVLEQQSTDLTAMEHRLYRLLHPEYSFSPIAETYTPVVIAGIEPEVGAYDRLTQAVMTR